MNRRTLLISGAVGMVAVIAWYMMFFAPKGKEISRVGDEISAAEEDETSLRGQLTRLTEIDENAPAIEAELGKYADAIPTTPNLASFILGANEIAVTSGITWLSVAPSEPSVSTVPGAPSTIGLSIQIEGGFFQVLDYLNRLEDLERLVVVDSIQVSTSASEDSGSGSGATDPSLLSVQLSARTFTLAAPSGASTPGSTSLNSTTTTTASGSEAN